MCQCYVARTRRVMVKMNQRDLDHHHLQDSHLQRQQLDQACHQQHNGQCQTAIPKWIGPVQRNPRDQKMSCLQLNDRQSRRMCLRQRKLKANSRTHSVLKLLSTGKLSGCHLQIDSGWTHLPAPKMGVRHGQGVRGHEDRIHPCHHCQ